MRHDKPSPEEIARLCKEIQQTWDEETRQSRIADPRLKNDYVPTWEVPEILGTIDYALLADIAYNGDGMLP